MDKPDIDLRAKLDDINARLARLQGAKDTYYLTTRYILELAHSAYDLFASSEVDEKQQLITSYFRTFVSREKNVVWDVQKPFDLLVKIDEGERWRQSWGALRTFRWSTMLHQLRLIKQKTAPVNHVSL
jgi:hypothetical protein